MSRVHLSMLRVCVLHSWANSWPCLEESTWWEAFFFICNKLQSMLTLSMKGLSHPGHCELCSSSKLSWLDLCLLKTFPRLTVGSMTILWYESTSTQYGIWCFHVTCFGNFPLLIYVGTIIWRYGAVGVKCHFRILENIPTSLFNLVQHKTNTLMILFLISLLFMISYCYIVNKHMHMVNKAYI